MARAPAKAKAAAKPESIEDGEVMEREPVMSTSKEVVNWEEQMLADAEIARGMEKNVGGTPFFKTQGGVLNFQGQNIPGNVIAAVVLDSIMENILYEDGFDDKKRSPPICFAYGRNEEEIKPHESVVTRGQDQNEQCAGCPMNRYGTADKGRGKACSNRRRLLLVPGGTIHPKTDEFTAFKTTKDFAGVDQGFLSIPPTALKAWASYVQSVFLDMKRPPYGVYTKITLDRDAETQIKFTFELLGKIPNDLMPFIYQQHEKAMTEIETPHNLDATDDAADGPGKRPPIKGGKGNLKPAAKPAPARKSGRY